MPTVSTAMLQSSSGQESNALMGMVDARLKVGIDLPTACGGVTQAKVHTW